MGLSGSSPTRATACRAFGLGSVRIDLDGFTAKPVNLREVMFGL